MRRVVCMEEERRRENGSASEMKRVNKDSTCAIIREAATGDGEEGRRRTSHDVAQVRRSGEEREGNGRLAAAGGGANGVR